MMITQLLVDEIRCRVMLHLVRSAFNSANVQEIYHLWFDDATGKLYGIRPGNPPHDQDRPKFMRKLNLVLDLGEVPMWVVGMVAPNGFMDKQIEKQIKPKFPLWNNHQKQVAIKFLFDALCSTVWENGRWKERPTHCSVEKALKKMDSLVVLPTPEELALAKDRWV